MKPKFSGTIVDVFSIKGRGSFVAIDLSFEGVVKSGDLIAVPLRSGEVLKRTVIGVEYIDSLRPSDTRIGLRIGPVDPQEILVGGDVVAL